jgi:hypothetical protein
MPLLRASETQGVPPEFVVQRVGEGKSHRLGAVGPLIGAGDGQMPMVTRQPQTAIFEMGDLDVQRRGDGSG